MYCWAFILFGMRYYFLLQPGISKMLNNKISYKQSDMIQRLRRYQIRKDMKTTSPNWQLKAYLRIMSY